MQTNTETLELLNSFVDPKTGNYFRPGIYPPNSVPERLFAQFEKNNVKTEITPTVISTQPDPINVKLNVTVPEEVKPETTENPLNLELTGVKTERVRRRKTEL